MPEHTPAPTPHRAVYGFAIYLLFLTLFILYVLWALLPTDKMGLTYLPDKYFALFPPIVVLFGLTLFIFFIYPAIGTSLTPEIDETASVADEASIRRICGYGSDVEIRSWEQLKCHPTPTHSIKRQYSAEPCLTCDSIHLPSKTNPIATLRFMDLDEVNESIFGC